MKAAMTVALVALAIWTLHRLALWAEGRGWVFYRHGPERRASIGNALLEVQSLVEPSVRHVIDVRRADVVEEDEDGEPPQAGSRSKRNQHPPAC